MGVPGMGDNCAVICTAFYTVRGQIHGSVRSEILLLGHRSCLVGILLLETLHATGGIDQLLLAGEKGMATGAYFDANHLSLDGRAGLKRATAGAVHLYGMVIGMDSFFHEKLLSAGRSARIKNLLHIFASLGGRGSTKYTRKLHSRLRARHPLDDRSVPGDSTGPEAQTARNRYRKPYQQRASRRTTTLGTAEQERCAELRSVVGPVAIRIVKRCDVHLARTDGGI